LNLISEVISQRKSEFHNPTGNEESFHEISSKFFKINKRLKNFYLNLEVESNFLCPHNLSRKWSRCTKACLHYDHTIL